MKIPSIIVDFNKQNKSIFKEIFDAICSFDRIVVFRHIRPDYDAYGSQLGLANWIRDNFPKKEVRTTGDNHSIYSLGLYPKMDKINESWFEEKPFLAIIVDAANAPRIADPRYKLAKKVIKIDHHKDTNDYGDIKLIDTSCVAASEIVSAFLLNYYPKYKISEKTAKYLYTGIVGDSGQFAFDHTTSLTFAICSELCKTQFNLPKLTQLMFEKPASSLEFQKWVLNNYVLTDKGVAYYILEDDDLKHLNITVERGKEQLKLFEEVSEAKIYLSITRDEKEGIYRLSIRSKGIAVNELAEEYEGGGHPNACGGQVKFKKDIPELIKRLEKLIK